MIRPSLAWLNSLLFIRLEEPKEGCAALLLGSQMLGMHREDKSPCFSLRSYQE